MNKAATKSYLSFNTLRQYFTLESTDYWHLQYPLNNNWGDYYWDMSLKADLCNLNRDKEGITTYYGEDGVVYYSIIELSQYAMASYQMFKKTNQEHWYAETIKHLEKALSFITSYKDSKYALLNEYPVALFDIAEKWPSSLAYGVLISLLIRIYEIEKDNKYIDYAMKLANNYFIDIEHGGVKRKVDDINLYILEEYPSYSLTGVLNGHITALWSINDLGKYDEKYRNYFNEMAEQLAAYIHLWNSGYWSYYDLVGIKNKKRNIASIHYHMLHIKQLFVLYRITNNATFANFTELFIKNKYSVYDRTKAFIAKLIYRLILN